MTTVIRNRADCKSRLHAAWVLECSKSFPARALAAGSLVSPIGTAIAISLIVRIAFPTGNGRASALPDVARRPALATLADEAEIGRGRIAVGAMLSIAGAKRVKALGADVVNREVIRATALAYVTSADVPRRTSCKLGTGER